MKIEVGKEPVHLGDIFEYIGKKSQFYTPGKLYTAIGYFDGEEFGMTDDRNETQPHYWSRSTWPAKFIKKEKQMIAVTKPSSPVQERVVKELVPGVYGRIEIIYYQKESNYISLRFINKDPIGAEMTAKEIRDAANTFLTIADYLEGK